MKTWFWRRGYRYSQDMNIVVVNIFDDVDACGCDKDC